MIFLSFNSELRLLDWIWCYLYCDWRQFRSIFSVMACLFPRECWESIPIMNIKRNFHVLSLMWVPWFSLIRVNLFWGSTLEFKIIAAITVNLLFESQVCCQNHLGLPWPISEKDGVKEFGGEERREPESQVLAGNGRRAKRPKQTPAVMWPN